MPHGEAGLGGNVLKDDGTGFYKTAGSDGALLGIEDRGIGAPGVNAHGLRWGALGRGSALAPHVRLKTN